MSAANNSNMMEKYAYLRNSRNFNKDILRDSQLDKLYSNSQQAKTRNILENHANGISSRINT
jgi:hypothetical protein